MGGLATGRENARIQMAAAFDGRCSRPRASPVHLSVGRVQKPVASGAELHAANRIQRAWLARLHYPEREPAPWESLRSEVWAVRFFSYASGLAGRAFRSRP